jgi:hypothetical protein
VINRGGFVIKPVMKTAAAFLAALVSTFALGGCSASSAPAGKAVGDGSGGNGNGNGGNGGTLPIGGTGGTIPAGGTGSSVCTETTGTTISGYAYDPAGKVPLYNVLVYVPVQGVSLAEIREGASCEKCAGREARAVAVALTDAAGHFVLQDTPSGANVPLVIEAGKWRREVTIPNVTACQENVLDDPELTRLPRNQSEGHLPKIAMVTGHSDAVECLLRKIGISDEEFSTDEGSGRVNMFYGCIHPGDDDEPDEYGANKFAPELGGADFPQAVSTLYNDPAKLATYDMLILSCEGSSCQEEKTTENQVNLKAYSDAGGRIFFDHMHYRWFNTDDAWQTVAEFSGSDDFPSPYTFQVDDTFPKGAAFADWLVNVQASPMRGQLDVVAAQNSAQSAIQPMSQQWVYTANNVQYMTINTPVEEAENEEALCGRLVHTDLHVTAGAGTDSSNQNVPFPGGCTTEDLSPQEKALEFILFDLGGCVQKEDREPEPPVVVR